MTFFQAIRQSGWTVIQYRTTRADPRRVRADQSRRFRSLLRHAVARSPFYREKYRDIDVETCRLDELPVTTKAELMAEFDRVQNRAQAVRNAFRAAFGGGAKLAETPQLAGAFEKGSQDAYRAIVRHQLPGVDHAADESKKHTRLLERVEDQMKQVRDVLTDRLNFGMI